jgi:hypothetical protein
MHQECLADSDCHGVTVAEHCEETCALDAVQCTVHADTLAFSAAVHADTLALAGFFAAGGQRGAVAMARTIVTNYTSPRHRAAGRVLFCAQLVTRRCLTHPPTSRLAERAPSALGLVREFRAPGVVPQPRIGSAEER